MVDVELVEVTKENINEYPPRCFLNPKNIGQKQKNKWTYEQLKNGIKIKLAYTKDSNKLVGFIEYIPGEHAWRAVNIQNFMFIHCIWVSPKKMRKQLLGSLLIDECIRDAKNEGMNGVAVVTSSDSFMADNAVFLKNNFCIVEESNPYSLLVKELKKGGNPRFTDWKKRLAEYQGLHIVYSRQCPWVARFMDEMKDRFKELDIKITELKTAKEAQHGPSIYTTFNLIYNGKLLSDHYISKRRFENIIKKELS